MKNRAVAILIKTIVALCIILGTTQVFAEKNSSELIAETVTERIEGSEKSDTPNAGTATVRDTVLAFPGALGSGAYSKGGRGGRIIEVTNLNNKGPGSFREALTAQGPRIIVFRVGGIIEVESEIVMDGLNSFVTVAGQTAPGGGILLSGHKMHKPVRPHANLIEIIGPDPDQEPAQEIVFRYIRLRLGRNHNAPEGKDIATEQCGDCLAIFEHGGAKKPMKNIMFDHCSFSWSQDENISVVANIINITFQNNSSCVYIWKIRYE